MPPSQQVVQWLNEHYPKPRVDPEWLDGCVQWLEDDQKLSSITDFVGFMRQVEVQLLESDLVDSMQHGTGLDFRISTFTGKLQGPPVMVQIMDMTEVGSSAFNLEQVRVAREERILAGEGDVEGDEEGDVEVEGEGPMPKYPRGHLKFILSDGATEFEAFEFRAIPEFAMGTTPLGFKLQLKGTRFHKGMAMLEMSTINLLGGRQAELQAGQLTQLKRGLRVRLGRPLSPEPQENQPINPPANVAPAVVRSPLRDISPPPAPLFPQHEDDIEMEPRRRLPANSSLNNAPVAGSSKEKKQDRPIAGLPSRHPRTSTGSTSDQSESKTVRKVSAAERATLVYAGSQAQTVTSPYFERSAASGSSKLDFHLDPTSRQAKQTLPDPGPSSHPGDFDFELFDDMDQENAPPAKIDKGKGRADASNSSSKTLSSALGDDNSSDYGMDDSNDFADPAFLEDLAKVEKAALSSGGSVPSSHVSSDPVQAAIGALPARSSPASVKAPPSEVIEIDDSDDEMLGNDDKENEPVATRHIRRRTEDAENPFLSSPGQPSTILSQKKMHLSQKTGKPVILAKKQSDIIDLSESD